MDAPGTTDLFPPEPHQRAFPGPGFDPWASFTGSLSRGLSKDTEAVQRAMWTAFRAWCDRQNIDPVTLSTAELESYLRSREGAVPASELTPRYTLRLVTLIGRVLNHSAAVQRRAPNRSVSELLDSNPGLKHANAEKKDPLPEILSDSQDRTLVSFLESTVPAPGQSSADSDSDSDSESVARDGLWQVIRNRTGVALQRGAGLTPLELRMLRVDSVFVDPDPAKGPWKVRAPATGSVQAHDAPVAKWARPILAYWIQVRAELEIPGNWLLPSTRSGKPWGKTAQFDSVADVFESAGLKGLKGGSYRLRHTFAMRQLSRPQNTEATVAAWMGIEEGEMKRYRGIMMAPVDVV